MGDFSGKPPRKKAKHVAEKDPAKRDLAAMPRNVLLNIFQHLDLKAINNCAILCSTLNNVAKDSSLYKNVTLKYNMSSQYLEALVSRISQPHELYIEYKFNESSTDEEDQSEFSHFVTVLLRKCGECLHSLKMESCKSDEVLLNISECVNLTHLTLYRCKSTFQTLPQLCSLQHVDFVMCQFAPKIVCSLIENNPNLQQVSLSNNSNINANEVCEIMSRNNLSIKQLHLSEKKRLKAKSLRTLARLSDLRKLEVISSFDCDPEDSLEQVAAGCSKLEKLAIYGWRELNDENFLPALHMFTQLRELDLRGTNITIRTCREAALTLPKLKTLDVFKSRRVKKAQLRQLQRDFDEIHIPVD